MTRGIRNNNPLNIRRSRDKWQGMADRQTDKAFVQFTDRKYGYRAAFIILKNYMKVDINTINRIIHRWAPSSDGNNTQSYIQFVSQTTDIPANRHLRFSDRNSLIALVRSMAQMESGIIEDIKLLEEAYDLSLTPNPSPKGEGSK